MTLNTILTSFVGIITLSGIVILCNPKFWTRSRWWGILPIALAALIANLMPDVSKAVVAVRTPSVDSLMLYATPSEEAEVLEKTLARGDELHVVADSGGWIRFREDPYYDDWHAWAKKEATTTWTDYEEEQARIAKRKRQREAAQEHQEQLENSGFQAWMMAQTFVKRRLKAPATAEFPSQSRANILHEGDGIYSVSAYVDAENAFGANLRQQFTVKLRLEDDLETWSLLDIEI